MTRACNTNCAWQMLWPISANPHALEREGDVGRGGSAAWLSDPGLDPGGVDGLSTLRSLGRDVCVCMDCCCGLAARTSLTPLSPDACTAASLTDTLLTPCGEPCMPPAATLATTWLTSSTAAASPSPLMPPSAELGCRLAGSRPSALSAASAAAPGEAMAWGPGDAWACSGLAPPATATLLCPSDRSTAAALPAFDAASDIVEPSLETALLPAPLHPSVTPASAAAPTAIPSAPWLPHAEWTERAWDASRLNPAVAKVMVAPSCCCLSPPKPAASCIIPPPLPTLCTSGAALGRTLLPLTLPATAEVCLLSSELLNAASLIDTGSGAP